MIQKEMILEKIFQREASKKINYYSKKRFEKMDPSAYFFVQRVVHILRLPSLASARLGSSLFSCCVPATTIPFYRFIHV
jgi:hypothetical protein